MLHYELHSIRIIGKAFEKAIKNKKIKRNNKLINGE